MAKNDMPGMKGQAPTNPYEGMWGPVGGGNAAPYGGNSMPWLQAQQPQGPAGGIQGLFAALRNKAQQSQGQGQQNPNAAFNRPQFPGQGQPPFMGLNPPMMGSPNPNGGALPEMAAASSIGPSQNQGLLEAIMRMQGGGQIGQAGQPPVMGGGNIPPNAEALQNQFRMNTQPEPGRYELPSQDIAGMGAPPTPGAASVAPTQGGSIFSRMRNRNG